MTPAQAVRYTTDTEGWQIIEQEIRSMIAYNRGRLMDCKSWDEVLQHRSAVESLESVLVFIDRKKREVDGEVAEEIS